MATSYYRPLSAYTTSTAGTRASAMPAFPPVEEDDDQRRDSQIDRHYLGTRFAKYCQEHKMILPLSREKAKKELLKQEEEKELYKPIGILIGYMKTTQANKKRAHRFYPWRIVYSLANIYREKKVIRLLSKNPQLIGGVLINEKNSSVFSQKGQETLKRLKANNNLLSKVPAHEDFKQESFGTIDPDLQSDKSEKSTISPPPLPALFSSQYARERGMKNYPTLEQQKTQSDEKELRNIDVETERPRSMSSSDVNLDRLSTIVAVRGIPVKLLDSKRRVRTKKRIKTKKRVRRKTI